MEVGIAKVWQRWKILARRALLPISSLLVVLILWQTWSFFVPAYLVPSPRQVASLLVGLAASPDFVQQVGVSCYRIGVGFVGSAFAGIIVGLAMGYLTAVRRLAEPLLLLFQSIPSVCWALLAILWFGLSDMTPIFVVFSVGFPIMLTNTWEGTKHVDRDLAAMARSFHFTRIAIVRKIVVPSVLSYVFAGARLAFGFGWRISILAEALGATRGVGYKIMTAADLARTDQVFAWTLTIVAFMMLAEYLIFRPLERRFGRWRHV